MTHALCLDEDQIAAVHEDRAGEQEAAHLHTCARCRARVAEYAAFVNGAPVADGSRVHAAADAMTRALSARLDAEAAPASAANAPLPLPPSRRPVFAWAALAAATALVVVAGATFTLLRTSAPGSGPDAVRGPSASAAAFVLRAPQAPAGRLRLEWEPVAGADGYELHFFGADLTDLADAGALRTAWWESGADSLPAGLVHGARVMAEVRAMARGERIATSEPLPVVVP
jgi:hypothetical protein